MMQELSHFGFTNDTGIEYSGFTNDADIEYSGFTNDKEINYACLSIQVIRNFVWLYK